MTGKPGQGSPPQATAEADAAATPFTLVYLDVDDEITSAASRIRYALADRVALVLPYGSRLATSRINFRLLAREAAERGKHIEIICADSSARALAVAAGLPVYSSVAAFEGRAAPPTRGPSAGTATNGAAVAGAEAARANPREATAAAGGGLALGAAPMDDEPFDPDDTRTRVLAGPRRRSARVPIVGPARAPVRTGLAVGVGLVLLVAVVVAGFVAVQVLPSATITLYPRSEDLGPLELAVEARPDVTAPDAANLLIPAQQVTFQLDASQTFAATGVRTIETKATGSVLFSNNDTGRSNQIPAGSIVETESGVQFKTVASVSLPPAFLFPFFPSTASIGVEAVEPGPGGNVDAETITVVPKGENRRLLDVINRNATSGGESTQAPQVSESDVVAARAAIEAALVGELDRQVAEATGVPAGATLFPETRAVGAVGYEVDPQTMVGADAAEFALVATASGTALAVHPGPIDGLAQERLRARVTSGWTLVPDSIATIVGEPVVVGGFVSYPVSIEGTQVRDVDEAALVAAVRGLVLADARSRLDDFGDVDISLWPDWVTNIPTNPDRITFELGEPRPSASPAP